MADISGGLRFRIESEGGKELIAELGQVSQAENQATSAAEAHGKSTSKLTQFIKEERAENRMRSFLFRESRESMLLASSALLAFTANNDGASKATKELSKGLVEGFAAFNAADFALKGLGIATGGVGIAIASVIGLGTAFSGIFTSAQEAARGLNTELERQNELLLKLGLITKQSAISKLSEQLNEESAKLNSMTIGGGGVKYDFGKFGKGGFGETNAEDYAKQVNVVLGLQVRIKELNDQILEDEKKKTEEMRKQQALLLKSSPKIRTDMPNMGEVTAFGNYKMGDIALKKDELKWVEAELNATATGERRNELLEKRKKLQKEINELNMTDAEKQQEALMVLGQSLGQLQRAMDLFGVSQESLIGKMIDGFDRILTIVETINAISKATEVLSAVFSGGVSLLPSLGSIFKSTGTPTSTGSTMASPVSVQYNVSSADAKSVETINAITKAAETLSMIFSGGVSVLPTILQTGLGLSRTPASTGSTMASPVSVQYNVSSADAKSFENMLDSPAHRRAISNAVARAMRSTN